MSPKEQKTVFIAAISSDIGRALAELYIAEGWLVAGTFRNEASLGSLRGHPGARLLPCDVSQASDIDAAAAQFAASGATFDMFIGAVGQLWPIGAFFDLDRDAWLTSVMVNGWGQLALLHALQSHRLARPMTCVALLVGGAINRGFPNYSAYSLGKLQLVKFCELIHEECPDMHAVAIGTGWVATKIHGQTLAAAAAAGDNLGRTQDFLSRQETGTSMADIKACIDWCFAQPREVTGGRNFSIVHDPWRNGGHALVEALGADSDGFKLRRSGNAILGAVSNP